MENAPKANPRDAVTEAQADELRNRMEQLQSKLHAAKIAFHNRTELDGKVPEYDDVAAVAKTSSRSTTIYRGSSSAKYA